MARELKYPVRHYVRISEESDAQLQKLAKTMGLKVSECLRVIVEHQVAFDPIKLTKEGKYVRPEEKK
jgi:hypothetical protein